MTATVSATVAGRRGHVGRYAVARDELKRAQPGCVVVNVRDDDQFVSTGFRNRASMPARVSFSGGSPRNIIRICKAIFDQQSELDPKSLVVSERAVLAGIEQIAAAIAAETVPENVLRDLKKLKRADFTVTNVYADVFRISQGSGTQKVQSWQDSGAVIKIGNRQEKRGNRPSNVYAVISPMVLKHIFSELNALDFAQKKMRLCDCGQLVLRDWDSSRNQSCHACEHDFGEDATALNPTAYDPS